MKRKFSITVIIFFSAFMLNVSAMAFQQRYDRREDDEDYDPYVIEMMDQQVLKYLKNTWFFDWPLESNTLEFNRALFLHESGFGIRHTVTLKPFLTSQLKFLMIEYIGFFRQKLPAATFVSRDLFNGSG